MNFHYMKHIGKITFDFVRTCIDFFYPPFRRFMTIQFFRYVAVGCINLTFDWILYFTIFHFVLKQNMLDLGFVAISSHIATLGIKFPIVMVFAFSMQKYITFFGSDIPVRIQLFRYLLIFLFNLLVSYVGLKLLVDRFGFYPTPSNMIITTLTVGIGYIFQKYFAFKTSSAE